MDAMTNDDTDEPDLTEDEIVAIAAEVPLRYTHAVEVFAAARGARHELDALAREEIAELLRDGLPKPQDLIFHTFCWHGEYNIMLIPKGDEMCVDLCERETTELLDAGPFKGRRASFPHPFSEDEP